MLGKREGRVGHSMGRVDLCPDPSKDKKEKKENILRAQGTPQRKRHEGAKKEKTRYRVSEETKTRKRPEEPRVDDNCLCFSFFLLVSSLLAGPKFGCYTMEEK